MRYRPLLTAAIAVAVAGPLTKAAVAALAPRMPMTVFINHHSTQMAVALLAVGVLAILSVLRLHWRDRAEQMRRDGFYEASEAKWRSRYYCAGCNPTGTASRPASMHRCPYCWDRA